MLTSCPGMVGSFVGLGTGIMRNAPPALFAAFAGLQWFTLGSSFVGEFPDSSDAFPDLY
jgi:hypothetical protein